MRRFLIIIGLFCLVLAAPFFGAAVSETNGNDKAPKMNLVGVLVFEDHPRALIAMPGASEDETLVNEGDLIEGYTVRRIDEDQVELVKGSQTEVLLMANAERAKPETGKTYLASAADEEQAAPVKRLSAGGRMKRVLATPTRSTRRMSLRGGGGVVGGPRFIRPISVGFVSSPFGLRRGAMGGSSQNHKGTDIAAPFGTPIYAAADGTVVESAWSYSKGNYIVIRHDRNYETAYFHLSKRHVESGQTVQVGQRIGSEGNTGISYGAHLHFEIHYKGVPVNAADYVRSLSQR